MNVYDALNSTFGQSKKALYADGVLALVVCVCDVEIEVSYGTYDPEGGFPEYHSCTEGDRPVTPAQLRAMLAAWRKFTEIVRPYEPYIWASICNHDGEAAYQKRLRMCELMGLRECDPPAEEDDEFYKELAELYPSEEPQSGYVAYQW